MTKKVRIGILGTSEIAFRRFLPALMKCPEFTYVGVASRDLSRTAPFIEKFGGKGYASYDALLADEDIDAVYVPLPPALHFQWGKKALKSGKHIFMEKPFTTTSADTKVLLSLADEKGLAIHENYMFLYHSQLRWIEKQVRSGAIGDLRLIRAAFGFPKRADTDFRYNKELGGGALLDCGGYTVQLAEYLLGESTHVTAANLVCPDDYEVDLYGTATLENNAGQTAQITFGMDNSYKCELELWGSTGCLTANRIFTAPVDFAPVIDLRTGQRDEQLKLPADDSFRNSIQAFSELIHSPSERGAYVHNVRRQSDLTAKIVEISLKNS
ncbi:MAG TPA: Gfo/Idh/MocA family oxidoreductase [Caproicibacter sp.]|nr:Gfo/Idh/MocA family oxidoreductase [Caproicibacter sp.]